MPVLGRGKAAQWDSQQLMKIYPLLDGDIGRNINYIVAACAQAVYAQLVVTPSYSFTTHTQLYPYKPAMNSISL